MSFSSFGLSENIIHGIYGSGFCTPTEIQSKAIPLALNGKDIIGFAPTGTGKTAAFVIPILQRFLKVPRSSRNIRFPRALILTPTRELALQITESIRNIGMYSDISSFTIYGGVGIGKQLKELQQGIDIVVATPGRLLDHIDRQSIILSCIEILVLDEADRMYDMGFIKDVRKIITKIPRKRQTLLFSATMSNHIRDLITVIQNNPESIEIGDTCKPVETVSQYFFSVPQSCKFELLTYILRNEKIEAMLVFSKTKYGADRISKNLVRHGFSASVIHADRSQAQRNSALEAFKRKKIKVLVATDLASRGIDIEQISHVLNFDTPAFAEDYIHRIGRTGRAQFKGTAFTFVSEEEEQYFKKIEMHIGKQLQLKPCPNFKTQKK